MDNKEATAIVTSMLASGDPEGAWRAYQTLASKYQNSGVHKVWEALDRLTGRQLSGPLALTVKLTTLRHGLNSSTLLAVLMTLPLHSTSFALPP